MSQLLGSDADVNMLLEQPACYVSGKRVVKRGRRTEVEYLVSFPDFEGDDAWYSARQLKNEKLVDGEKLIADFEQESANAAEEVENGNLDGPANQGVRQPFTQQPFSQQPFTQQLFQDSMPPESQLNTPAAPGTQAPHLFTQQPFSQQPFAQQPFRPGAGTNAAALRPGQSSAPPVRIVNGLPSSLWGEGNEEYPTEAPRPGEERRKISQRLKDKWRAAGMHLAPGGSRHARALRHSRLWDPQRLKRHRDAHQADLAWFADYQQRQGNANAGAQQPADTAAPDAADEPEAVPATADEDAPDDSFDPEEAMAALCALRNPPAGADEAQDPQGADADADADMDADMEEDEAEEEVMDEMLAQYLGPELWAQARIKGAKQVDGGLVMTVVWDDGFEARVDNVDLKTRVHCKDALIDFYESKIRRVQPSPNTRSKTRRTT
ncbi:hypothetical protein WJX73_002651 [Symbiochloris irregularis]|uniref:Chromo domain-containing protein n=1 Tax=Symbiochloris irregularis TaxID=706552 RepID=A0AAW1NPM0_9CHLO